MARRYTWLPGPTAALVSVAAALTWWSQFPQVSFDPVAWHDESRARDGVRLRMADTLVATEALLGRTRAEVVQVLGEPPPTGYFRSWDLVYWLGDERAFFSIDSEWLVLRLDAEGRVVDCQIVRD